MTFKPLVTLKRRDGVEVRVLAVLPPELAAAGEMRIIGLVQDDIDHAFQVSLWTIEGRCWGGQTAEMSRDLIVTGPRGRPLLGRSLLPETGCAGAEGVDLPLETHVSAGPISWGHEPESWGHEVAVAGIAPWDPAAIRKAARLELLGEIVTQQMRDAHRIAAGEPKEVVMTPLDLLLLRLALSEGLRLDPGTKLI